MLRAFSAAWREVRWIICLLAVCLVAFPGLSLPWLSLIPAALLIWVAYFFRDPDRVPDSSAPGTVLSPADGRITDIEQVEESLFIQGPCWRVSIFLSLFDVHNQRAPYPGVVRFKHFQKGAFAPAYLKDTHLNESHLIGFETADGPVAVRQIAGILARRIVCWPAVGEPLAAGQRFGLIKFGSRVDLYLPLRAEIAARVGQQVYGGKTVVAGFHSQTKS